jgi:hypothetical protein
MHAAADHDYQKDQNARRLKRWTDRVAEYGIAYHDRIHVGLRGLEFVQNMHRRIPRHKAMTVWQPSVDLPRAA